MKEKHIYAIEHPHGFYKIGRASNAYDRASAVQTSSPYEVELRFVLKAHHSSFESDAETTVHNRLEEYQHRAEWFDLDKSTILRTFHEIVQDDGVEGSRIYDIRRRRERENRLKNRHERLNRRPSL